MRFLCPPGTYHRLTSTRTGDVILEARVIDGMVIVHGVSRPDEYDVHLVDGGFELDGVLRDRVGPVMAVDGDAVTLHHGVLIDVGPVAAEPPPRDWSQGGHLRRG